MNAKYQGLCDRESHSTLTASDTERLCIVAMGPGELGAHSTGQRMAKLLGPCSDTYGWSDIEKPGNEKRLTTFARVLTRQFPRARARGAHTGENTS